MRSITIGLLTLAACGDKGEDSGGGGGGGEETTGCSGEACAEGDWENTTAYRGGAGLYTANELERTLSISGEEGQIAGLVVWEEYDRPPPPMPTAVEYAVMLALRVTGNTVTFPDGSEAVIDDEIPVMTVPASALIAVEEVALSGQIDGPILGEMLAAIEDHGDHTFILTSEADRKKWGASVDLGEGGSLRECTAGECSNCCTDSSLCDDICDDDNCVCE